MNPKTASPSIHEFWLGPLCLLVLFCAMAAGLCGLLSVARNTDFRIRSHVTPVENGSVGLSDLSGHLGQ